MSSDKEEPMQVQFNPVLEAQQKQFFGGDSEGSKSEHSSASEVLQDENQKFDDPQYPGVTDINDQVEIEEPEEKDMEFEGVRKDEELNKSLEVEEEEEIATEEPEPDGIRGQKPTDCPLRCRGIRIGSYKIHPYNNLSHLPVNLSTEAISFRFPSLYDSKKFVLITLKNQDISRVLVHFGKFLPVMFVFTSPDFGEALRAALHGNSVDDCYFDPTSKNEKIQMITFLIDSMLDEQCNFIKHSFLGYKKGKEIDEREANEILVKSTPDQNALTLTKLQVASIEPTLQVASIEPTLQVASIQPAEKHI